MSGLTGDWKKLEKMLEKNTVLGNIRKTANRIGAKGAAMVKKTIQDGQPPGGEPFEELRAFTVWMKGTSHPLKEEGDLMGSVTYAVDGLDVKVGATKTSPQGHNLAEVHEFGKVIEVTPKMRKGFAATFRGLGIRKETKYIVIPERSYLRSTLHSDEFIKEIEKIFEKTMGFEDVKASGDIS